MLIQCFRFAIRSHRFIDVYQRGLNGTQVAWAVKKYKGHRVLPEHLPFSGDPDCFSTVISRFHHYC
ncbi:hypothetical protein BJ138DRAFT_1021288 [Hygrophoropsis aurantiaca]|uniref:Uncharacterized protein n=1 Tax=Hygrophoropsis aurantiaca TaxID=72124 RepID=A0ACB7ZPG7_9AGAM|nr:hypothetical protein BJ138DRAFT_1021288 [Hygrophoropsis aurantiaca]